MFTTRYGISSACISSSSIASSRSCSAGDSSGTTKANISTLSNWWTRKMPRVSLPAAPASRRKQVEGPLHEGELEAHERPLQIREAGAGHPCACLQVHQRAEQLQVVAASGAGLSHLAQHLVLRRRRVVGEVRKRGQQLVPPRLGRRDLLL